MKKLKKHAFSSLYEMSSGISTKPEQAGKGFPFLSFGTVYRNFFIPETLPDLMNTSLDEQEKYSIKKGDVFLTRTSETVDELAMSCVALKDYPNSTYSGFTKRLRPIGNSRVYEKYIGFYLRSKFFRKVMTNNAVLTTRASLNEKIFSYLSLLLPDFETQVKTGDFLHLINEKITLNNRINAELESMAKTLYDYWFVQFDFPNAKGEPYKSSGGKMVWNEELKREIPAGWEAGKLGKCLKVTLGGTPSTAKDAYWENGHIPWLSSAETANFPVLDSEKYITDLGLKMSAATLLPKGSVVVSIVRYIRPSILGLSATANQSVAGIFETDDFKSSYIYLSISHDIPRLMSLRTGAQQPHINKETIEESPFVVPGTHVLSEFYELVNPIFGKILKTAVETKELTTLRDWLLPMLMNGQVTVGENA